MTLVYSFAFVEVIESDIVRQFQDAGKVFDASTTRSIDRAQIQFIRRNVARSVHAKVLAMDGGQISKMGRTELDDGDWFDRERINHIYFDLPFAGCSTRGETFIRCNWIVFDRLRLVFNLLFRFTLTSGSSLEFNFICSRPLHLSNIGCLWWQTSSSNTKFFTTGWIVWSWLWFIIQRLVFTISSSSKLIINLLYLFIFITLKNLLYGPPPVFVALSACIAVQLGDYSNLMFYQCIAASTLFYAAHWQTYVSAKLRFGRFDVTEAQFCIITMHLVSAFFGPDIWRFKVISSNYLL